VTLKSTDYINKFKELIQRIAEKHGKVVLLVDEYDKPIVEYLEEIETAKEYFQKILITNENCVDALVELGLCEATLYNMSGAIEYFEKAVKLKEDPEILCNLGMAYLNNGEIDDAIYFIERAYELNPEDEITNACLNEIKKYR